MAFDLGELVAKLKVDSTQLETGIKTSRQSLVGLGGAFEETAKASNLVRDANGRLRDEFGKFVTTGEQAGGTAKRLGDQFTFLKSTADRMHNAMLGVMQGVGQFAGMQVMNGVASAFGFAKDAVFGFNSTIQNSTIAFTTMLGSGEKAQVFLDQLKAFAKSTPFEFEDLVASSQNMMGMGIAAKDVIPDLTALGDSVASIGGSAEQVKQVTLAFDQMAAKGTLDMGNMNQLMQGGVPNALKIMASAYGVTTGKMIEMISAGDVQSSKALPALISGLEKGTASTAALGGMMDQQSHTFTGALSNISDGLTQAMAGAFKPFFDVASSGAQSLATFFSSSAFSTFGDRMSSGISKAFSAVKSFNFSPVINAFNHIVEIVRKDIIPIGKDIVTTFGPPLVTAFGAVYSAIGPIAGALKPVADTLKSIFDFVGAHATTFQGLAVGILAVVAAQKLWTMALAAWAVVGKVVAAVQWLINFAMDANPIGLIVLAIVGLVAAFVYLWTHSAAFRNFFIGLWDGIWSFLKTVGAWFAGPFASFFVSAWNIIAGVAMWLWHNVLEPFWQNTSAAIGFVLNIVTSFANLWAWLWRNTIGAAILWMWHTVWEPAFQAIAAVALWLWNSVLTPMGNGINAVMHAVGAAAMWLWHNAIDPAFHAIGAVASWAYGFLKGQFDSISRAVSFLGGVFSSVFSAIGGYVSKAFSGAVGIVRGALNGIIGAVNTAIGGINSVIHAANSIPGVNFPTVPSIPKLAFGGAVAPSKGGTPVIMGDGGQVEYGVPRSDMEQIIGQAVRAGGAGGGGTLHVVISGDGILRGIRETVRVQGGDVNTVLVGA